MPFQPGQSGNPAGRPRGARNKATVLMETLLDNDGEDLIRRYIEQAKAGDIKVLGFLMGVILPKRNGALIALDLPPLEKASDAPIAIAAIISAVCSGELTPQEGIMLTRMVEAFLRADQKVEKLVRKLERLADVAAKKMREAPEPHVMQKIEGLPLAPAMVQADAPRSAGEFERPFGGGGSIAIRGCGPIRPSSAAAATSSLEQHIGATAPRDGRRPHCIPIVNPARFSWSALHFRR